MPGFDRSGPMGAGPMSGGSRGMCGGAYNQPAGGYGAGYGRGMGLRRSNGRGRGFGFAGYGRYPAPAAYGPGYPAAPADEMTMLKAEARAMQASLEAVQKRISDLEKEGSE